MRRFSWILTLPILVIAVVFSVSNRQPVVFDIWPLDLTVTLPAFLPVLGALFIGVLVGGLISWLSAGRGRARARQAERDLQAARQQVSRLEREKQKRHSEANMESRALSAPSSARPAGREDGQPARLTGS